MPTILGSQSCLLRGAHLQLAFTPFRSLSKSHIHRRRQYSMSHCTARRTASDVVPASEECRPVHVPLRPHRLCSPPPPLLSKWTIVQWGLCCVVQQLPCTWSDLARDASGCIGCRAMSPRARLLTRVRVLRESVTRTEREMPAERYRHPPSSLAPLFLPRCGGRAVRVRTGGKRENMDNR
ncbi:hypothetical protein VDBG_05140 [Verticillium alfalfae VaMs.102]|uniref:Uncharacterized protein n=1 Tax=Verticillium alfalfae (strain VaMs.102 / ATCC MYA-4576 / FGSC 10136) TaxID=526221 RepID=C9SK13_VERA1|nr:hypothetical protein VDBG_05140 [Verticillium alfalfae VaMs.102]EEY19031.1 hypothetical protein VDBG_05140 [Verticillium alfalfae VaMs.102]